MSKNNISYDEAIKDMKKACEFCETIRRFHLKCRWEGSAAAEEKHGYHGNSDDELFLWRMDYLKKARQDIAIAFCEAYSEEQHLKLQRNMAFNEVAGSLQKWRQDLLKLSVKRNSP